VPFCIVGLVLAARFMAGDAPSPVRHEEKPRLDVPGLILITPAVSALILGLSNAGRVAGFVHADVIVPLAVGGVLLAAFTLYALCRAHPLVDVRLLARRPVASASAVLFFSGFALYSAMLPRTPAASRPRSASRSGGPSPSRSSPCSYRCGSPARSATATARNQRRPARCRRRGGRSRRRVGQDRCMTIRVPFYFVDVFASQPLTGNPLSLVPDADDLDQAQMRAVAREFNQSETTFLLRPSLPGATVRLRSFTPAGAEVGGAGHNALGAWVWLEAAGRLSAGRPGAGRPGADGPDEGLAQELAGRVLPVEVIRPPGKPAEVWLDQAPPQFGATAGDRSELAAGLGLTEHDLGAPAQVVSTGAAHLLVPVRDRTAVDRAAPDPARLAAVLHQAGGEGCYLYSLDPVSAEAVAYARFFNPTMGIAEDPATGSAAGPLAARLAAEDRIPQQATVVVEQGHALGRPSLIRVAVSAQRVRVGGSGLVVAEGTLAVS
jgi:PhzF family phenazine biosynthesis protein